MTNRIQWSSLLAGAISGLGACLVLAFFLRALSSPATPMRPLTGTAGEGFLAVIMAALAFSVTGFVTTVLGRFSRVFLALLNSATALSISYLFVHFFLRDAFFLGRAGLPFDMLWVSQNLPAATTTAPLALTGYVGWTVFLSAFAGVAGCMGGTLFALRFVDREARIAEPLTPSRAA